MGWTEIWTFLQDQLHNNQFLTGATLTGFIASIFYLLRGWFIRLFEALKRFFNVSLTIHSEDVLYIPITSWLYKKGFDRFSRNYRVRYTDGVITYGPDEGTFFFLFNGKLIKINLTKENTPGANISWRAQTRELLKLSYYSFSRSTAILHHIIDTAIDAYQTKVDGTSIYVHSGGCWAHLCDIKKRDKPSIVLAGNALECIEKDVENFLSRRNWYLDRGIPYHRGYLLTGPPGTGKTSLVRHLAQKFNMPLHVSDGTIRSITAVPPKSIILLEDVDSIAKMKRSSRELVSEDVIPNTPTTPNQQVLEEHDYSSLSGPTLSELLNALDGIASPEEVIVIMTTNFPEKLDPAVVRPGRIDYKLHLGECTTEQAVRLYKKFFGNNVDASYFEASISKKVYTPAQLQDIFIRTVDNPNGVLELL